MCNSGNRFGAESEKKAAEYLQKKGYKILAINYRIRGGEIDIVAFEKNVVVFVEVKARSNASFGSPLEAITYNKLKLLQKTAYFFLSSRHLHSHAFRFDAIEVTRDGSNFSINHLKNITM